MTPTTVLTQAMLDLLAADGATLSPAAGAELQVKLVASAFTPNFNLLPADITLATFTGSTPIAITAGDQEVGYDPTEGEEFIQFIPPEGGWYWEATAPVPDGERIYGAVVTNFAGTTIYASMLLSPSVLVMNTGDSVVVGVMRIYLSDFTGGT